MRVSRAIINELQPNQIFVFGSNTGGIHGAGAAKLAYDKFGAKWGVGFGHEGQSFALPSKEKIDTNTKIKYVLKTLPLDKIQLNVDLFIDYAKSKPNLVFLVTEIGCGLAGYKPKDIAPLFVKAVDIENIYLPETFWNILNLQ